MIKFKSNIKIFILLMVLLPSCNMEEIDTTPDTIIQKFNNDYTLLPEEQISISTDESVYASYAAPTERYTHGIMGDIFEGGQLVIAVDGIFHELNLTEEYVFEDIRPRLFDVDGDGELEFITIRSHLERGAGIVIYKILVDQIIEYARVPEIGTANRWLNIVAIDDLDNDGQVEITWIETPHIGGILKVAKINPGNLEVLDEKSLYSNHAIGQRNLCLSFLAEKSNQKIFYVPNQTRDQIVGFSFQDNTLNQEEEINQIVDFTKTLNSQFTSGEFIEIEDHCIYIE